MTKNQLLATIITGSFLAFGACNSTGYKKTDSGLEYRIVKDADGDTHPQKQDIIEMHVKITAGDSTILDSRKMNSNQPFQFPLMEGTFKGDWLEGVKLLTKGDSAVFRVPMDSVRKYAQGELPPGVEGADMMQYEVVLVDFQSQQDAERKAGEKKAAQLQIDDEKLQKYLQEKNINAQRTESGLYYKIDKQGSGKPVEDGSYITVNYTGTTLEGKKFDSNVDPTFNHVEPFSFVVGKGMVIPGWDEGVQLLKEGSEARFFIPSTLAYGQQDMGNGMGQNAVLVFDVEVTKVGEKAQTAPMQ